MIRKYKYGKLSLTTRITGGITLLKKMLTAFMLVTFVFAPVAEHAFVGTSHEVSAKSYRSGKKSFNSNNNQSNFNQNKSTVNKQKSTTNSNAKATKTNSFNKGGFMKSMMLGGIAGLLFGGLLANMGAMGSVLGLLLNVLAILLIVALIKKIFTRSNRPRKEVDGTWRQ